MTSPYFLLFIVPLRSCFPFHLHEVDPNVLVAARAVGRATVTLVDTVAEYIIRINVLCQKVNDSLLEWLNCCEDKLFGYNN